MRLPVIIINDCWEYIIELELYVVLVRKTMSDAFLHDDESTSKEEEADDFFRIIS